MHPPKKDVVKTNATPDKTGDSTKDNQKIEQPKLTIKGRRRASALSLNSIHKKSEATKKEQDSKVDTSNLPKEPFTHADFYVHWKKYISILSKQGNKILPSILSASEPVLKDTVITLTYPNAMMVSEVKKQQTHVLNYLRDKLRNYQISFNLVLDEKEEKSYAYTPEEKYNKLRELNPLIDELRKKLYLDL